MKKLTYLIITTITAILFIFVACKKEKEATISAQELSEKITIEGASRIKGNIPVPDGGEYGTSIEIYTDEIIVEENKTSFDVTFEGIEDKKIAYFKVDGSDDYFELELDEYGSIASRISDLIKEEQKYIGFCIFPGTPVQRQVTVQFCKIPKNKTKAEAKANKQNWCTPKNIKFQCIYNKTGNCSEADIQAATNKLISLTTTFQNNPTNSNCNAVKAAAMQLLQQMKNCNIDDASLTQAANAWNGVDCSLLN
ncbi:MAG: hypothetical protein IPK18_02955 [Sphingobacteriales bacterium]|nr:MAG: hypothetical protein IPK18_02955 [Sphingobacteriales bacterium]